MLLGMPGNKLLVTCCRSNDIYPNTEAGNFSEIDVEWLNGNPAKEPGSLWFNAFTE
jgi:hypothetical protein